MGTAGESLRTSLRRSLHRISWYWPGTLMHGPAAGLKSCECLPLRRGSPPPDSAEDRYLTSLSLEGQVVYDIGAHIGIFSLAFARQVGKQGRVVAFEPFPPNYRRLERNLKLNRITNVLPVHAAVGAESGERIMASCIGEPGRISLADKATSIGMVPIGTMKTIALDSLLHEEKYPRPDFIKIDVEGFEWEVLQGARELLRSRHPRLFIELHGADDEDKRANARRVIVFLDEHGYAIDHVESGQRVTARKDGGIMDGHLAAHVPAAHEEPGRGTADKPLRQSTGITPSRRA